MLSPHEILHEDNYNALYVAICYKKYLSPENAFYVYMTGHMPNLKVMNIKDGKHDKSATSNRYQEIYALHKSGMSNKDIAQVYGMKKSTITTILSRIRHNVVR